MIRKVRWAGCAATSFALLVGAASCGGAHDAVRPDQPTAAGATGRVSVKPVEGPSSPLIVDWKAEQRADLEEAVHDGIAIVAWDDQGLRLLRGCKLTGDYGYLPVQVKKDVVRLETADEVQATLPLGGLGIAGKIGGGFEQGTTLDIALAMVGKRRTTWSEVKLSDLKGNCQGATHYVRALTVGAFAMKTGAKGSAAAAVQIFGAGTSGSTSSSKDVSTSDGSPDACDKATGEETKPPSQCAAILRVELEPISKDDAAPTAKSAKAAPEVHSEVVEGCPPGFIPGGGGACKRQTADVPHVCALNAPDECNAQCSKGNAESCDRLGFMLQTGRGVPRNPSGAQAAFAKACDGGYASSCTNLGISLMSFGGPNPRALAALDAGCRGGSARGCEVIGEIALQNHDAVRALRYYTKGCEGGNYMACTNAGFLYGGGGGQAVQRDDQRALQYARRACYGNEATACGNAGYKVELGEGVPANPPLAAALYERACRLEASSCFRLGFLLENGAQGVSADPKLSRSLLERSCQAGPTGIASLACVATARLYGSQVNPRPSGLTRMLETMAPQCEQQDGRACTFLAIALYGLGKPGAPEMFRKGCSLRDPLGCDLGRKLR